MKHLILLIAIFSFPLSSILPESVLGRYNIYLGQPKVERSQVSKEVLEEEKNIQDRNRKTRTLEAILENGNQEEQDFLNVENEILFTNLHWKLRIEQLEQKERIDRVEYKINQSTVIIYKKPIEIPQKGINLIEYRSIDRIGNMESWKIQRVYKDTIPPKVDWEFDGKFDKTGDIYLTTKKTKINVSGKDQESGIQGFYFKINNGKWKSVVNNQIDISKEINPNSEINSSQKQNIVHILALDQVMNRSFQLQIPIITIDSVLQPNLTVNSVREFENERICNQSSSFTLSFSPPAKTERAMYRFSENEPWQEFISGFIPFSGNQSKNVTLFFKSTNSLGLESKEIKWDCKIDNVSPNTEVFKIKGTNHEN